MGSKTVMLDDDAIEYLDLVKSILPPKKGRDASYSDAVKYHRSLNEDIFSIISNNFTNLNKILLNYYQGNASKAHITKQLQDVLLKAVKDKGVDYEYVSKKLNEIMEGKK